MYKEATPVIVTGAKRSGTTLFQCLLDATPGTFMFLDESYFLEYIYDMGEESIGSFVNLQKTADAETLFQATAKRSLFHFFEEGYYSPNTVTNKQRIPIDCDFAKLKRTLAAGQRAIDGSIKSVWDMWAAAYMDGLGYDKEKAETVVIKCPDYGKSALAALRHFEHSRNIVIVRDPVYAIDSLKVARRGAGARQLHLFELFKVINDYKFMQKTIEETASLRGRVAVVIYEQLIADPRKGMDDICRFIGAPFDESFLKPTFFGQEWYGESNFGKFGAISAEPVKREIKALTPWEVGYIESELGGFMKKFGYAKRSAGTLSYVRDRE